MDEDNTGGRFLLAGSAGVAPGVRIHSGAGRIVSIPLRPLSFVERGMAEPAVSLRELLTGGQPNVGSRSPVDLPTYTDEILGSGFPGIRGLPERARQFQLDSYIARIVERELPENGVTVRRPRALTAWLTAYGAATATDASYSKILDAATAGQEDKPARDRRRLSRASDTDLRTRPDSGVDPRLQPPQAPDPRTQTSPRRSGPCCTVGENWKERSAAGRGRQDRSVDGNWLGALFESLVAQSVRVYAEAANAQVGHLRTKDTTREIDLIVEGDDRRVVAIEVKLAATVDDHDVRHLNWLRQQIGSQLSDRVVITTGEYAYRRPDGVAVVPLALLGP